MRQHRSTPGFVAGIALGVLVGSAGLAAAALQYKGWSRNSADFQQGYLAGFHDMALLARNVEPDGYVDQHYPYWPQAKPIDWYLAVKKTWELPENQSKSIYTVLQIASKELTLKYGDPPTPMQRSAERLKKLFEGMRKKDEEARQKRLASGQPPVPPKPKGPPPPPPPKKWCKCAEMEKACPELAKEFTTRKPRKDDDEDGEDESGKAPAAAPAAAAPAPAPAAPAPAEKK